MKKCVVCGFNKGVQGHHIIKRKDCGSNEEDNIVDLCPNHHWIADFGEEKDKLEILSLIKENTGKVGKEIDDEGKEKLDRKIRVLEEEYLCTFQREKFKPFTDEEWEKHRDTWNYETQRKFLLGRGCSIIQSRILNERAEKLILIHKLKESLQHLRL